MSAIFSRFEALAALDPAAAWVLAGLAAAGLLALARAILRLLAPGRDRAADTERAAAEEARDEAERRLAEVMRMQGEITGRMQTMAEVFSTRQADLARALSERIDGLSHKVGGNLTEQGRATAEHLSRLNERIAVIDRAQAAMTALTGEVGALQGILSNKQLRGAFGQGRMEAIVTDALPAGAYAFQPTLSNGNRPDCLIFLPNGAPALVVDAKFPLEAFERRRAARDQEARALATREAKRDLARHVADIRERYFVPGETFDTAFLFVPSESVFADIHEHFSDVVDRATRLRILVVSPSLLLLSIQVVQTVLRDTRMREQALLIRTEVAHLLDDVTRLRDRSLNLQKHFGQATADLDQILISAEKIGRRGGRIDALGLEGEDGGVGRAAE